MVQILNLKNYIPNSLTLLNLLSGCIAIVIAFMGRLDLVPYFVIVCLFADFSDGLIARKLKANSPIGADLDSLADMVSFGLLPGIILFLLIDEKMGGKMMELNQINYTAIMGFSVTIFSALRLAIFNIDDSQESDFKGLATPASTVFVVGILLLDKNTNFDLMPFNLVIASLFLSFFLVSNIKMFSFKLKGFSWKDSAWQYIFLTLSVLCMIWLKWASISLIIIIYIVLNLVKHIIELKNR